MLVRQTAPVIGAVDNVYQRPGEWQVNLGLRALKSDTHYRLDERQHEREELGTFVVNRQHVVDLSVGYAFTKRISVSAGLPYVSASWSIPTPTAPVLGPRAQQDARGFGDLSVTGRTWLFDPAGPKTGNIAVGIGMKAPTGDYRAQDRYPDRNGNNNQPRFVDQSIQPGDGGWGVLFEVQGFKRLGPVLMFGSGTYLANPRDTNGTPSLTVTRLPPGAQPAASAFDRLVNSVPDQYVTRVGAAIPLRGKLGASASYRIEGQRRYDLIGESHGFRRPGVAMFVEPGLTYTAGRRGLFVFSVPVTVYRNRKPDPYTGLQGDATFPKVVVLASYAIRFGGQKPQPATPKAPWTKTGTSEPETCATTVDADGPHTDARW
jgi:hypothetical protein